MTTLSAVQNTIRRVLGKNATPDAELVRELALDSLDLAEVTAELGDQFEIPDDAWDDYFRPIIEAQFFGKPTPGLTAQTMAEWIDGRKRAHS